jgi:hypothetical protein
MSCSTVQSLSQSGADVQNAAYEVFEGAKKQDLDWNPEENGGFAAQGKFLLADSEQG